MSLGIGFLDAGLSCGPSFLSALGFCSNRMNALCISLYIYVFSESIQFVCEVSNRLGFFHDFGLGDFFFICVLCIACVGILREMDPDFTV